MRLLVIRTSAMGDVALVTAALRAVVARYPEAEIVVLTRPSFLPFFSGFEKVSVFPAEMKGRHKGFAGLLRLFSDLRRSGSFDHIIDLHDVMRSQILRGLFMLSGVPSSVIDKGRKERRDLVRGTRKEAVRHSVLRYLDVFTKAGFPAEPVAGPWIIPATGGPVSADQQLAPAGIINAGIAPFAKHKLKMWPLEKMLALLKLIADNYQVRFFLFGGREDKERLEAMQAQVPGSVTVTGSLSLERELELMSRLDLMIAMDSSNMHMAALTGTRVVSVWGATDRLAGFGAWMQPEDHCISIPFSELDCRPCTIYGKGKCRRGDLACLEWLTAERVFGSIREILDTCKRERSLF